MTVCYGKLVYTFKENLREAFLVTSAAVRFKLLILLFFIHVFLLFLWGFLFGGGWGRGGFFCVCVCFLVDEKWEDPNSTKSGPS